MKLSLRDFKCYKKHDVEFKPGTILLTGANGSGKTTILKAIDYALYGKVKNQYHKDPKTGVASKSCSVKLSFGEEPNGLWIQRTSGPGSVQMYFGGTIYKGADAEANIVSTFGTREVFLASSFMRQGKSCPLLSGTNAEKMALIRTISFQEENVEEIQDRIRASLKDCQEKVKKAESDLALAKGLLENFDRKEPRIKECPPEKLADFDEKKEKAQGAELEKKIEETIKEISTVSSLESKISTLEKVLAGEPEVKVEETNLEELEVKIKNINAEIDKIRSEKARRDASNEFGRLREKMEKEVQDLRSQHTEYAGKITVAPNTIPSEITRIRKNATLQGKIDTILKTFGCANAQELRTYSSNLAAELRQLRSNILVMEKDLESREWNETQLRTLVCPQCSSALQIDDGKLRVLVSDYKPSLRELTYSDVTRVMIDEKKKEAELMEVKKNSLQTSISELNNLLKDLNFYDPTDADKVPIYEKYLEYSSKLAESEKRLSEAGLPPATSAETVISENREEELKKELDVLLRQRSSVQESKTRSERRAKTLSDLDSAKTSLGDRSSSKLSVSLKETKDLLSAKKELWSLASKFLERRELLDSLDTKDKALTLLSKEAQKKSMFLELSRKVEIETLEKTVAILNQELARFLDVMFPEEPIFVEFKTVRESKTNSKAKSMTCSTSIFYKNCYYGDNDEELSGGEADRVSLAMTLVLGSLLGNKIFMLDECDKYFDVNVKISIAQLLKQVAGDDKMCLTVSHGGVEGVYDATIRL